MSIIHFTKDNKDDHDLDSVEEKLEDLEINRVELIAKKHAEVWGLLIKVKMLVTRKEKAEIETFENDLNKDRKNMLLREVKYISIAWMQSREIFSKSGFTDENIEDTARMFKRLLRYVIKKLKETYKIPVLAVVRNQELRRVLDDRGKRIVDYINNIQQQYAEKNKEQIKKAS